MQLVTYAARPALAWAAVKGPVMVWAVTPAPQKPVAPTTAKSANADTVLFPDIVMLSDPSGVFRHPVWCRSRWALSGRSFQAVALRQKPVTHLGLILPRFWMFRQKPAPQVSARRRRFLAVHLYVNPAVSQGLKLLATERKGARKCPTCRWRRG